MNSRELLPVGDIPQTEWAGRAPCNWLWDFERRQFEEKGGHPIYGASDVEYRFNSHGYRCPEFSEIKPLRIVAIGCSYVFGFALPQRAVFPELLRARLESTTGKAVVLWNLAFGGASNDYIARVLQLSVPLLRPDIVLINFTWTSRKEYVAASGEYFNFLPGVDPDWNPVLSECFKHFQALASEGAERLNLFKNYKAVEALLSSKRWLFSAAGPDVFASIDRHIDPSRFVGTLFCKGLIRDFARDHQHPGPKMHERLAQLYWQALVARGWIERFAK